jgi:hypothetical protein
MFFASGKRFYIKKIWMLFLYILFAIVCDELYVLQRACRFPNHQVGIDDLGFAIAIIRIGNAFQ